jgi:outer membrane protein TolC
VEARSLLVRDEIARVQEGVVRLFWAEALARRLLATLSDVEKALSEAQGHVERSLARSDGVAVLADRYRIAVFQGILRERATSARRGLDLSRIGMAAYLSTSADALTLQPAELDDRAMPLPGEGEARAAAEERRSDLQALAQAIRSKEAEVRMEEAAALPQFFVGAYLSFAYAPNRALQTNPWVHDYFNEFGAGIALGARQDLAIPVLVARAGKARAERAALERRRDALRTLLTAEVASVLAEARAAQERMEAARSTLNAGRSWFRAATLDFAADLAEGRDLVEAYAGYVESQAAFAQATYEARVARAHLDLVTGALPVLGEPPCTLR